MTDPIEDKPEDALEKASADRQDQGDIAADDAGGNEREQAAAPSRCRRREPPPRNEQAGEAKQHQRCLRAADPGDVATEICRDVPRRKQIPHATVTGRER